MWHKRLGLKEMNKREVDQRNWSDELALHGSRKCWVDLGFVVSLLNNVCEHGGHIFEICLWKVLVKDLEQVAAVAGFERGRGRERGREKERERERERERVKCMSLARV